MNEKCCVSNFFSLLVLVLLVLSFLTPGSLFVTHRRLGQKSEGVVDGTRIGLWSFHQHSIIHFSHWPIFSFFLSFFLSVSVSGCVFPMERQRRSDYPVSIAGELTAKNWRWIHQDPLSLPARFPVGGVALVRSTDSPVESFIYFFCLFLLPFSCLFDPFLFFNSILN